MTDADILKAILDINKTNQEDLKSLRSSSHEIRDELHRVSGQFELLRQDLANQKTDNKERFERVHARIDKEQDKLESIQKTVNDIAPKAQRTATILDWATRFVVLSMMGGLMWATVQFISSK